MKEKEVRESDVRERTEKSQDTVKMERLEERIALSLVVPKKTPEAPPYPPGTRYSLARRENIPEPEPRAEDRQVKPEIESLEEKVALSVLVPKKTPEAPPYPPGTLYGLARQENIPGLEETGAAANVERGPDPEVEELEEKVALSIIVPKKTPEPPPYPPGADYSLARRENLCW